MNNQQYIEKWLDGTLTEEEKAAFEKTEEFKSLQRMDAALKHFHPKSFNADEAFGRIKARRQKTAKVISVNWSMVYRIAAVLVAGIGLLFFLYSNFFRQTVNEVQYSTLAGETKSVTLPDNTVVTLNALSLVTFSEDNWSSNRNIKLEGEAYFDVVKGGSFKVETSTGTVTVLGTRFTVKDRPNFYEVICYEGRVEVKASAEPVLLTQHDFYRETGSAISKSVTAGETAPAWMNNESSFSSVPYFEVINELKRQYNVSVQVKEVDTLQVFTGKFPNNNLTTALQAVTIPLNLSYQVNGREIVVFHDK
ncbi:MAG TPA: FecR domain-containing protein [Cyclobacteriaceae bacterium]|nr:FecR domain-containing protein [Cyclobacteriaceae bacterium]HRJ82012.1 FecR domain-containing protein [Cyclobacteriaceae bacterium]